MNENYTRISTVLKPFSGLDKVPEEVLKNACERGTKVHEYCDALIKGMPVIDVPEHWQGYVDSFKLWHKDKQVLPSPGRMYCDDYKITGEMDGLYHSNPTSNQFVLFDLKTPLNESKTWKYQLSAYQYLARKKGLYIVRTEAIQLRRNGDYPIIHKYEYDFVKFSYCLDIYREFFADKKEIIYDLD